MNLVQMSRSLRACLSILIRHPRLSLAMQFGTADSNTFRSLNRLTQTGPRKSVPTLRVIRECGRKSQATSANGTSRILRLCLSEMELENSKPPFIFHAMGPAEGYDDLPSSEGLVGTGTGVSRSCTSGGNVPCRLSRRRIAPACNSVDAIAARISKKGPRRV